MSYGRTNVGSAVSVTLANSIASNAYSNVADAMRVRTDTGGNAGALLGDFRLTKASSLFGAAPTAGTIYIAKIPRDASGNAGPVPSSSMVPTQLYPMGPISSTGNSNTAWVLSADAVPLSADADYYIYNNGTGQSIQVGATLTCTPWNPGV